MSRVGKAPVVLPKGVEAKVTGQEVRVKGPKGELHRTYPRVSIRIEGGAIVVGRPSDEPADRALHGASRAGIANMVRGVVEGYAKGLQLEGVGYRAQIVTGSGGSNLSMTLGFSHPVVLPVPAGIKVSVEEQTKVRIEGIDKEVVGQFAAKIRAQKPAEPYQGKGVRYEGEQIRRKAGKSAVGAGGVKAA